MTAVKPVPADLGLSPDEIERIGQVKTAVAVQENLRKAGTPDEKIATVPEIEAAEAVLTQGNPVDVFRRAFYLNHCGDEEVLRAVIYAAVLQSSQTTKGLQIFITGDKGSGKSSAVKAAVNLLPPSNVVEGSFSDKAFFLKLKGRVKPAVFLDDVTLSDPQIATVKRCMTNYQKPTEHNTIIDHKLAIETIPARTLWLGNAVNEAGDDQLKDRFLSLGIQNNPENDKAYVAWELQRRKEGRSESAVNEDVNLARAILQSIAATEFVVIGMENIEFGYVTDRRLINICLDLMEANTILHYRQRQHEIREGVVFVHPSPQDLDAALAFSMFAMTDKTASGRLTKAERALDQRLQEAIGQNQSREYTESEIVSIYGQSTTRIRALLYGRDGSRVKINGGLLEKAPWYSLDTDPNDRRNIIRVQRHNERDFQQFASVTP